MTGFGGVYQGKGMTSVKDGSDTHWGLQMPSTGDGSDTT